MARLHCLLFLISPAQACLHDGAAHRVFRMPTLAKRQEVAFPPTLDENESILANSFETTDIDTWSYYYTHGLHVAGTNETIAQWTADRWNEFGFTSSLVSYCEYDSSR